jgi:hypothetical protein
LSRPAQLRTGLRSRRQERCQHEPASGNEREHNLAYPP